MSSYNTEVVNAAQISFLTGVQSSGVSKKGSCPSDQGAYRMPSPGEFPTGRTYWIQTLRRNITSALRLPQHLPGGAWKGCCRESYGIILTAVDMVVVKVAENTGKLAGKLQIAWDGIKHKWCSPYLGVVCICTSSDQLIIINYKVIKCPICCLGQHAWINHQHQGAVCSSAWPVTCLWRQRNNQ